MAPDRPVIFLHIGAMKTGTTFLQHLLSANRENLAEAGYLFPGRNWGVQTRATRDILGLLPDPRIRAKAAGSWERLSSQMLGHDGVASIFSMEFLSFADPDGAARVVDSLAGATVHVILGVRDTTGALPAQWQSNVRNGARVSWPEFVHGAMAAAEHAENPKKKDKKGTHPGGPPGRTFLRTQDIARMLEAWGSVVPPERLHVLTVPRAGSDRMLLWHRFAAAVGVDPAVCSNPAARSNSSLGQASADLMRRVNARLGKVPQSDYDPTLKHYLASTVLSRRADREQRAKLDLATREFAADWNKRVRAAIEASGVHLIGDLDDLPDVVPPELRADTAARLVDPDETDILAAAADARAGLLQLVAERAEELRDQGAEAESPLPAVATADDPAPPHWSRAAAPVEAAVEEVSDLVRTAIELHARLRDLREGVPAPGGARP